MRALHRVGDHRFEFLCHRRIGKHLHEVILVSEDKVLREYAGGVQLVDLNFPPLKRRANRMGEE
jgi:hypothetical protein